MNVQSILKLFVISFSLALFSHCNKTDEPTAIVFSNVSATEISETSFTANWAINSTEIKSLTVEVSTNSLFSSLHSSTIYGVNINNKAQEVVGLDGASIYYFRIVAEPNQGNLIRSETKKVVTGYKTDVVSFTTSDNYKIAGKVKYLENSYYKGSPIIFMHELGAFVNNWNSADLVTQLISEGYICLVLDFRGHGQSDDFDLQEIADDLSRVAPDLIAAIKFIKNHPRVDSASIALVGGSLGAIMSIAGNGFEEVKCTVSLSGARNGIYSIFPNFEINSAFFIVGELDNGGGIDFAEEASKLYDLTAEPKKLNIIPGRSEHGSNLLVIESLNKEIIDWINLMMHD